MQSGKLSAVNDSGAVIARIAAAIASLAGAWLRVFGEALPADNASGVGRQSSEPGTR